jgi:inorganic pyrophosphatase
MEPKPKVEYITDEKGQKKVVLPVETYEEMLEDIQDLATIAERKEEATIPFEEILKNLKADGLL